MDSSNHIDKDNTRQSVPARISTALLSLTAFFFCLSAALGVSVYWLATKPVILEQLSTTQLQRLVENATYIAPPIYQPFPTSGRNLFYHMRPNTRYENVFSDTFITNDLGFRAVPTTPKQEGIKRIVVVGDSWTFGQGVTYKETFSHQLQEMLNRKGEKFQVYNLAMPGWNTANEIAALQVFFSRLQPDAVVICPVSNDIDDGYAVWNGRTVIQGFFGGASFRQSYEYESRWIRVFQMLGDVTRFLKRQKIPSLIYFLPEWKKLAPYYAKLSDFGERYTVVPTKYIENSYRLPVEIDPGGHASPEGHRLIASYLFNALLEERIVVGFEPLTIDYPVVFFGHAFENADIEAEFKVHSQRDTVLNLIPLNNGFMGREGFFSVMAPLGARTVSISIELFPDPGLYPLSVQVQIASSEEVSASRVFEQFETAPQLIELRKPESLDRYPVVEVRIIANRVVTPKDGLSPISMKPPAITIR